MTPRSLRFSAFILDLDRLCVVGPAGKAELRPKSFEVLRYLVEHPGRVVGKEEVINAVWPDVTVTDESLTRCISAVRRALGDGSQQIIKTVPKRGYLLDVGVSVVDRTIGAEQRRAEAYAPDDFLFLTEGRPTVAVFPFTAISEDPQRANCVSGIAEHIMAALSRCTWLTAIAGDVAQSGRIGHRANGEGRPSYVTRRRRAHRRSGAHHCPPP
jgi:DNA-binding winged helix-turn-helix (wHTH) protein